ncbi:uncharacterized protein PG998_012235 [Apiospora kogelbergensis]|uniref:uncharacterized protein n=1 Tax=Apiospora kogelbergensis TaxID=1337665 RepID=UPI00312E4306
MRETSSKSIGDEVSLQVPNRLDELTFECREPGLVDDGVFTVKIGQIHDAPAQSFPKLRPDSVDEAAVRGVLLLHARDDAPGSRSNVIIRGEKPDARHEDPGEALRAPAVAVV